MRRSKRTGLLSFAAGVVATLAVAAGTVLAVAYSGGYNIAATEEHASFTRWAFEYKEYCQHCHAGPGVERAEWAGGMRPRPPHLTEAAAHWELAEIFWLVKHGAKMTGMPAFGPGHDDATLWGIAAFVKRLPAMTPEQYAAAGGGAGRAEGGGEEPAVLPAPAGGG
jgi:mono/diheme cytochrome c family protein